MLFILNRLFGVIRWPIWIIITIRHLMGGTIDAIAAALFRRFLNRIFVEVNCIRILRFIQGSIFGLNSSAETDQVTENSIPLMNSVNLMPFCSLDYLTNSNSFNFCFEF